MTRKIFLILLIITTLLIVLGIIYLPLFVVNNESLALRNFEFVVENEINKTNVFTLEKVKNDSKIYKINKQSNKVFKKLVLQEINTQYYIILQEMNKEDSRSTTINFVTVKRGNIFSSDWKLEYPVKQNRFDGDINKTHAYLQNQNNFKSTLQSSDDLYSPEEINELLLNPPDQNKESLENNVYRRVNKLNDEQKTIFRNLFIEGKDQRDFLAMKEWLDENYPETR